MASVQSIILYLLAFLSFGLNFLATLFGTLNGAQIGDLFKYSIGNISDKYYNDVTPASYVFGTIWPIIFLWTLLGGLYLVVSVCLAEKYSPLKTEPAITPILYFVSVSVGWGAVNAWYFAWEAENLGVTLFLLILGVIGIMFGNAVSLVRVEKNLDKLEKENKVMLWMVRILVQNGLSVCETWLTLATSLGVCIVILYVDSPGKPEAMLRGNISVEDASSIILGILLGLMIVWFVLENFVWEKYCRYIFSDLPVFILAFSGIVYKLRNDSSNRNLIMASVNLAVASVLFLARVGLAIYRFKSRRTRVDYESDNKKAIILE